MTPLRTALFGGSFNPLHLGHVRLAEKVLKEGLSDEVWLMISPHNPLKQQSDLLDENLRLRLAQKALSDHEQILASDFEFHLPRPSYTWQTLVALRETYPERTFSLLIGADNWLIFDRMYWQTKRAGITEREKQLETAIARYEREMTDFQQERKRVLAEAKAEAKKIVEESNARVENTIKAIKEAQAERERTKEIRADLTEFREKLEENTDEQDRIARKIAKLQRRAERKASGQPNARMRNYANQEAAAARLRGLIGGLQANKETTESAPSKLAPGSYVRLKGQNTVGKIESISGKNAKVLFGMMYSQVSLSRLEPAEAPKDELEQIKEQVLNVM